MKFSGALMLFWVAATSFSIAAEVMESLKTRGGREYLKVEVLTVDDVGIRIRHDAGTARISYQDLPDSLQSKYHFDRKKAAAAKAEESKNQVEHEKSFEPPPIPDVSKEQPVSKTRAPQVRPAADPQELENLEAYIVDLKRMVKTKTEEVMRLRKQAAGERSRTRSVRSYNSGDDTVRSATVPDKAGYAKADKYDEEASALERQIQKAHILIGTAEAKYTHLNGIPGSQ